MTSRTAVAQVKTYSGIGISRPEIQQIYGVAQAEGKVGLFFSLSPYTREARAWAEGRVGLFEFDLTGEPRPLNELAERILQHGTTGLGRP